MHREAGPISQQVTKPDSFASRAIRRIVSNARAMAAIQSAGERSLVAQLVDLVRLKLNGNGIKVKEYINQGFFRRDLYPGESLSSLGGVEFKEKVHAALNNIRWEGMVTDKLIQYSLLQQFDIPHPPVVAVASPRERRCGAIPVFTNISDLADFLRHADAHYPLYCKPIKGYAGRDINKIVRHDAASDDLILYDGSRVPLMKFLRELEADEWGFLFQEAAVAAPETQAICGDAVSGYRIILLLDNDRAYPYRGAWKVPRANNIVDNYVGGSFGNLICDLDVETGEVKRVAAGAGLEIELNSPQPDTGIQLLGTTAPQWQETVSLLSRAGPSFPGFRWQHWDVGISDKGPVIFELNSAGSNDPLQLSSGRGIIDQQIEEFMAEFSGSAPPSRVFK